MKQKIAILGSTGSIGNNLLEIIKKNRTQFDVVLLTTNQNYSDLLKQVKIFKVKNIIVKNEKSFQIIKKKKLKGINIFNDYTSFNKIFKKRIDYVMSSISGMEGLLPTIKIIKHTKKIAIANKESIICAWNLIQSELLKNKTKFIPVDSEHFSMWYALQNIPQTEIEKLYITASGGPLLKISKPNLKKFKLSQALKHPTWNMGNKISIDSATMMNKGLEIIEAMYLFDLKLSQVDVVIHPQSIVHSMVCYSDGSIISQVSKNDMKIPISYCLGWPERISSCVNLIDLTKSQPLTFENISKERFPCFYLAKEVAAIGESVPTVMNAANEVAVSAFLKNSINFNDIYKIIYETVEKHNKEKIISIEDVFRIDNDSRIKATEILKHYINL